MDMPVRGLSQGRRRSSTESRPVTGTGSGSGGFATRLRVLASRLAFGLAVIALVSLIVLVAVRTMHAERLYPAVVIADVPVGGLSRDEARAALASRAAAFDTSLASFTHDGRVWSAPLAEIGVTADVDAALRDAWEIGREPSALERARSAAGLLQQDRMVPLPLAVDRSKLDAWFDSIDADLGGTASNASLSIQGANVTIVPERSGFLVDRQVAAAELIDDLQHLQPAQEALPVAHVQAAVKATDLEGARGALALALATPLQVRQGASLWTLPTADLGRFVVQTVDPARSGAEAFTLSMNKPELANWLDASLRPSIDRPARDAEVGWNGEQVISVEESQDGLTLDAAALAAAAEQSFFGAKGIVDAPVKVDKPQIDSSNLASLGITTLLAVGGSNYDGSGEERRTNLERGAVLLNGTLIPPRGEFSFNHSIGYIDESAGFVEAQVIDGERIGKDVGGGICQVSTTVFRAAYLAGMPITEWWPHRFRIAFYEYDGWAPGLDASILQPSPDPSTWDDFRFYNPTDSWLLIESYTDGVSVTVKLYGPETGYRVERGGPYFGEKTEPLADSEVIDPELPAGTINEAQVAAAGQEVAHYRQVFDPAGNLLWEEPFYTLFYPRGNIWKVSPDMKGLSPSEPEREIEPIPEEERGEKLDMGAIAWEMQAREQGLAQETTDGWIDPATGEWVEPEAQG